MKLPVNNILQFIFDAIYTSMWFAILNSTHKKRFSRSITYLIQFLWFFLYYFGSKITPYMSLLRILVFTALFFFVSLLCYAESWFKILFSVATVHVVIILNELIAAGLYLTNDILAGNKLNSDTSIFLKFWIMYLCTGAVLFLLLYLFLNRQKYRLSAADWSMFALFPTSQFFLMYGWLDLLRQGGNSGRSFFFSIVVFVCIASDIGLFAAVMRIAQRAQLAAENSMLAAQVDSQGKHYQDLTAQYESIRRMRHDIANHLNAMESLMASGRDSEAQEYLQELNSTPIDSTLGMCEHPVVDAFLHNKINAAKSSGVEIDAVIDLPANVPISNLDLIRIFGNMLDNALDSCCRSTSPRICLNCSRTHGCLVISTSVSLPNEDGAKGRNIPGPDSEIGRRALSDIAAKYGGSFSFSEKDGIFKAKLILNLNQKDCSLVSCL